MSATFPNVPNVPGVPAVNRLVDQVNSFTGVIKGNVSGTTLAGSVRGTVTDVSGSVLPLLGTVRGVVDSVNNFTGQITNLSGGFSGRLVGQIVGTVDQATGLVNGTLSSVLTQVSGVLSFLEDIGVLLPVAEPFEWGLFPAATPAQTHSGQRNSGPPVRTGGITGDSVKAVEYGREFTISTYPVEEGGFQSYNKVETPFDVLVIFTKGGDVASRDAFLAACESALESLALYDVATPEVTYTGVNVVRVGYRRTNVEGATLLTVEVGVQKVRTTATAAFSNTKAVSGSDTTQTGAVQAVAPTPAQVPPIDEALAGEPEPAF